jgi:hypothetical protein
MDENKLFHASRQMNPSDIREFDRNVPPSVARDIVKDNAKSVHFPSTPGWSSGKPNYSEPKPLGPPPGIAVMDQMMAQEDRLWRRELANKLGVKLPEKPPSDAA